MNSVLFSMNYYDIIETGRCKCYKKHLVKIRPLCCCTDHIYLSRFVFLQTMLYWFLKLIHPKRERVTGLSLVLAVMMHYSQCRGWRPIILVGELRKRHVRPSWSLSLFLERIHYSQLCFVQYTNLCWKLVIKCKRQIAIFYSFVCVCV